jgi:hypothetical protein
MAHELISMEFHPGWDRTGVALGASASMACGAALTGSGPDRKVNFIFNFT